MRILWRHTKTLHVCTACGYEISRRISGPVLDRIDSCIEVPRVDYEELSGNRVGEPSASIRARLRAARDKQINAIHMYSGLTAELYRVHEGDELLLSAFRRQKRVDYGPPSGKVYIHSPKDLILYKLIYFGRSQQSKHSQDIAAILNLKSRKNELD